ncbi:MAG TPA: hypothetical protein VFY27_02520, partial [Woeseiaceae bacterium]|nr:hypothetical protein [Woeseiaceae bacterium]
MKHVASLLCACALIAGGHPARAGDPVLNELEYFQSGSVDYLVFSNWYDGLFSDSKISGIELIHHGERTATNGDVRLDATPEQWDRIPEFVEKKVDRERGTVEAFLRYPEFGFDYSIRAERQGAGLRITVNLPRALPAELSGKAALNLEFLPSAYFGKAWIMDEQSGLFPLYPTGLKEQEGSTPPALAEGRRFTLAPDDPARRVTIEAKEAGLAVYDGRAKAQNGWFVVRSLIPSGKSGTVLEWTLEANSIDGWLRDPVIG